MAMESGVKEVELRELWRRYKEQSDEAARERLGGAYSPMVKFVAGRLGAGLPSHVEDADLISYGLVGLIGAIARFEPGGGVKFETFPSYPLRALRADRRDRALRAGARDQIRDLRNDPHPRLDHRRTALARLGAALGPLAGARNRNRARPNGAPATA